VSASRFSCALLGSIPSEGVIRWAPGTRVGYVPQKLDLERDLPMTGTDLLRARLTLAGHSGFAIAQTFDLVGLSKQTGDQLIGTYSGGQFQQLLIAFALLGEPTVLLLDEPTASVDEAGQEQLNDLMHPSSPSASSRFCSSRTTFRWCTATRTPFSVSAISRYTSDRPKKS